MDFGVEMKAIQDGCIESIEFHNWYTCLQQSLERIMRKQTHIRHIHLQWYPAQLFPASMIKARDILHNNRLFLHYIYVYNVLALRPNSWTIQCRLILYLSPAINGADYAKADPYPAYSFAGGRAIRHISSGTGKPSILFRRIFYP